MAAKQMNILLEFAKVIFGGFAGIACGYLVICWISPGADFLGLGLFAKPHPVAAAEVAAQPIPQPPKPEVKPALPPQLPAPRPPKPEITPPVLLPTPAPISEPSAPPETVEPPESIETKIEALLAADVSDEDKAAVLVEFLEQAVKESKFDLTDKYAVRLLSMARSLDDFNLERRATLIYLRKIPAKAKVAPASKLQVLLAALPASSKTKILPTGLIALDCGEKQLTDDEWDTIGDLKTLKELYAQRTNMTDSHISKLVDLPLQNFTAWGNTEITDVGLVHIKKLKELNTLTLGGCSKVTDAGVVHLVDCQKLTYLGLTGTSITDEGLMQLAKIKGLLRLGVGGTKVTNDGIVKFKTLAPQCNVSK